MEDRTPTSVEWALPTIQRCERRGSYGLRTPIKFALLRFASFQKLVQMYRCPLNKPLFFHAPIAQQYSQLGNSPAGINVLVAASRFLAVHTPTMRSQEQTYQMAYRLHRGDRLFETTG